MAPKKKKPKKVEAAAKKGKAQPAKATKAKAAPPKTLASTRSVRSHTQPQRKQPSRAAKKAQPPRDEPAAEEGGEVEAEAENPPQDDGGRVGGPAVAAAGAEEALDEDRASPEEANGAPVAPGGQLSADDNSSDPPTKGRGRPMLKRKRGPQDDDDDEEGDEEDIAVSKGRPEKKAERSASPALGPAEEEEEEEQAVWDGIHALAEVELEVPCQFRKEQVKLRLTLRVHGPNNLETRLGYRARLTLSGTDPAQPDNKSEVIGYIHSWRMNKPTAAFPKGAKSACFREPLNVSKDGDVSNEVALCVLALFSNAGNVKQKAQAHREELLNNSLMFIETVWILPQFQGGGLLQHVLEAYHEALAALPEWYAFAGTIVLIPARPTGEKGNSWDPRSNDDVERILIHAYRTRGGYEVYVRNAPVKRVYVTVMGRTIGVEERVDEDQQRNDPPDGDQQDDEEVDDEEVNGEVE